MRPLSLLTLALLIALSGHAQPADGPALPASTITIASFNIKQFGPSKSTKPEVMAQLVDIIRKYDLICVQEVKDASGQAPVRLLNALNADAPAPYAMLLSERTGRQPDDRTSQEQYAYYYRNASIAVLDSGALYDDSPHDHFQREPFVARFKAVQGNFTFAAVAIHTRPEAAVAETAALHPAILWAQQRYPDEDDIIALGDFNASCSYATPQQLDSLVIRSNYHWLVPDSANTNLSARHCAYDRIVITQGAMANYAGIWAVDRSFTDPAVSDHWPIWAAFYYGKD